MLQSSKFIWEYHLTIENKLVSAINKYCMYRECVMLMIIVVGACNSSPVKVSEVDGNEFVSCNIDKVKDYRHLMMSEIAESCDIVFLENDTSLTKEDYKLEQVTVSDNFIVVIPKQRPALLYSKTGKFIKRLGGDGEQKYLWAIHSQIDKQENKAYIQVPGLEQLYVFGLKDNSFRKMDWAIKHTYDFVFIDSTTLFGIIHDKEYWGYLQSINLSVPNLVRGKYPNILHPYFNSVYHLLLDGDKIVFDSHQDTTYYYNPSNSKFTPFLCCYSEKNTINPSRVLNNIFLYGLDYEKLTDGKLHQYRRLLYASNGYFIFSIRKHDKDDNEFLVINKYKHTAFKIDTLINDFCGNCKVAFSKSIMPYYRFNNKDGYLTYHCNVLQFKEMVDSLDSCSLDALKNIKQLVSELKNSKKYHNVLVVNKLKKL